MCVLKKKNHQKMSGVFMAGITKYRRLPAMHLEECECIGIFTEYYLFEIENKQ